MCTKTMVLIGILMAPVIILAALFIGIEAYVFSMSALGYYVNKPGWEVAKIAAEQHDVAVCRKMRQTWFMIGPQAGEQRALCVYDYARLTQDPSACELLMPGEYGMNCIGQIWGKLIDESNCHWYKDNAVRCFEGIALTPHVYDCWGKSSVPLPDECKHRVAFREKKADLCDGVAQPILRSVCKVRIGIWKKYPELRSTIYFKDNIE